MAVKKKAPPKRSRVDQIIDYHRVFGTTEGKKVLFDLMKQHHILTAAASSPIDPYELAYREGERSVILRILTSLDMDPGKLREKIEEAKNDDGQYRNPIL